MLGGFNSVKRENHYYKYAHCETINELKAVPALTKLGSYTNEDTEE